MSATSAMATSISCILLLLLTIIIQFIIIHVFILIHDFILILGHLRFGGLGLALAYAFALLASFPEPWLDLLLVILSVILSVILILGHLLFGGLGLQALLGSYLDHRGELGHVVVLIVRLVGG